MKDKEMRIAILKGFPTDRRTLRAQPNRKSFTVGFFNPLEKNLEFFLRFVVQWHNQY
jgi:hypothetical protein